MSDIKALPWKIEIQLFVWSWFQGPAISTNGFIGEILTRHQKVAGGPFFYNLCRNGNELNIVVKFLLHAHQFHIED
jgi:hypothetical protein